MNLSFAGGGFQGVYYSGVVACLQKCAPNLTYKKVYGTSAGALAAVALLINHLNDNLIDEILRLAAIGERSLFGSFKHIFNSSDYIYKILDKYLPEDAHLRVNGKLCISLTTFTDAENVVVSNFDSRSQLIQALVCSCFIPLFSGILPPYFNGVRYMDGEMSNNRPYCESSEEIVTVSAFSGECDICPCDTSQQILHMNWGNNILSLSKENIRRLSGVLIPPSSETLVKICEQGFYDTLKYLYRNNYIMNPRCLTIASVYGVESKEVLQATMDVYNCPFGAGAIEEVRKIMKPEQLMPLIENCRAHIVELVDGE
uniref:Putative patatin-like phospholipase domain-containing protein 2 isoform x2 n=1 Tax=Lutzomyia longipalpis TaxID=7200 RepID=A0A1B0CF70_LUTLO